MIVVAGASGTLGPLLVPLLVARGEPVRVITRDPVTLANKLSGVELMAGDVTRPDDARRAVEGARVVVSAITGFASPAGLEAVDVKGNRILAEAAVAASIEQFVLLSVAQASVDHPMALFRAKFAAEQAVRASGLRWTMIRPSAQGPRHARRIRGACADGHRTRPAELTRSPRAREPSLERARGLD